MNQISPSDFWPFAIRIRKDKVPIMHRRTEPTFGKVVNQAIVDRKTGDLSLYLLTFFSAQ